MRLGWSLRGIPMITRVVRMLPDDNKSLPANTKGKGYMDIASTLTQDYNDQDFFSTLIVTNASFDHPLVHGDNEPDVYTCTLLSGDIFRFTLDGNGKPVSIPRNNVKIDFNSTSGIITVIDENGIKYNFDQFEETTPTPLLFLLLQILQILLIIQLLVQHLLLLFLNSLKIVRTTEHLRQT